MNPSLAAVVYSLGIVGLFYLDRDKSIRTSAGLWIPVMWLWILGSRGPSVWLGIAPPAGADTQLDGTPFDRAVFTALLVIGIVVLARRGLKIGSLLTANWLVLIYFAFCLASVIWSDFPGVAAKRWVKAIGDLVMVLIIVTDANPIGAFKRVVTRVGFIILPASVLLIKYYPALGRGYDAWHGTRINLGTTTNKNILGMIVLVLSLGTFWRVWTLLRRKETPNRGRHLLAQSVLLVFGISLLSMADSATSRAGFALGAFLIVVTSTSVARRRPWMVHAIVSTILIVGAGVMLGVGRADITHALGRNSDLTGRTGIWDVVVPMVPNPIVGAGYESFWLGSRMDHIRAIYTNYPINEAHNGYVEIYLNLGWIGVILIVSILISGYRRAALAFRRDPGFSSLLLAYLAVGAVYSVTEAGFRNLSPMWIFFLFAVVAASAIASGRLSIGEEDIAPDLASNNTNPRTRSANDVPVTGWRAPGRARPLQIGPSFRRATKAPVRSDCSVPVRL
jgi:exopolysaccharide production protein ExoQ